MEQFNLKKYLILVSITLIFILILYLNVISYNNNIIKVSNEYSETFKELNANVVLKNSLAEITIDKGNNNGIEEGDIAINSNALVGIVFEVNDDNSVIRLITNNQNKVSVKVDDNSVYGLLDEYNNNYLIMKNVSKKKIEVGSRIVTTGIGYIYPSGIYVGEVENIIFSDLGDSKVLIKTPVDFNNISNVIILKKW